MLRRWQVEDLGRLASRSQPATTSQGSPPATTSQGLQPATPPTASQEPDGEWVLVDIPDGRTKLTTGEWEEQSHRIHGVGGVLERANLRSDSFTTEAYVRQFGLVARGRNEYGNAWWRGMMVQYQIYPYQYRFQGCRVWLGWFMLPPVPGQAQSQVAPTATEMMAPRWFPAFFAGSSEDDAQLQMSCLHIVVIGCKPWWVGRRRAVNLKEVTLTWLM